MMDEAQALSHHARQEAQKRVLRARHAAAREAAKERGPEPIVCPPGANAKQRAAFFAAMNEITVREQQSKIARGWERLPKRSAPAGCIPLCALNGKRMAVIVIDLRGRLRLSEGGKAGPVVTVSEAVAMARG